jgi:hypothetical protein
VALVIGIDLDIARGTAEAGSEVMLSSRKLEQLEAAAAAIPGETARGRCTSARVGAPGNDGRVG